MSKKINVIPQEKNAEHFLNFAPASEFVPEWYRKSPNTMPGHNNFLLYDSPDNVTSTYKKCTPFFDAITCGYIIFLTADIEVCRNDDGSAHILWRTKRKIVGEHSNNQWIGFPCPEGYTPFIFKWNNEFLFQSPKNYSLLFINPINRFDLPFVSITGLVDCDTYDLVINFPFFIKKEFSGIIEKGTPISQVVPIKRESWSRNYEKYDENKKAIAIEKYFSTIKRSYKNNYWHKKEYK